MVQDVLETGMIHGQVKPVDGDPSSHALAGELAPGQPDFSFQEGSFWVIICVPFVSDPIPMFFHCKWAGELKENQN